MNDHMKTELMRWLLIIIIILIVFIGAYQCTAQQQKHQLDCVEAIGQKECLIEPYRMSH